MLLASLSLHPTLANSHVHQSLTRSFRWYQSWHHLRKVCIERHLLRRKEPLCDKFYWRWTSRKLKMDGWIESQSMNNCERWAKDRMRSYLRIDYLVWLTIKVGWERGFELLVLVKEEEEAEILLRSKWSFGSEHLKEMLQDSQSLPLNQYQCAQVLRNNTRSWICWSSKDRIASSFLPLHSLPSSICNDDVSRSSIHLAYLWRRDHDRIWIRVTMLSSVRAARRRKVLQGQIWFERVINERL